MGAASVDRGGATVAGAAAPPGRWFGWGEFAVSAQFPALASPVPAEYRANVARLVATVLDPLRAQLGRPVRVLSGYRSAALNRAVAGSVTSQHRRAEAADLTCARVAELFYMLLEGGYPVGQVIYYPSRQFVHVALPGATHPRPSFHIHEPRAGYHYRAVGLEDARRTIDEARARLRAGQGANGPQAANQSQGGAP